VLLAVDLRDCTHAVVAASVLKNDFDGFFIICLQGVLDALHIYLVLFILDSGCDFPEQTRLTYPLAAKQDNIEFEVLLDLLLSFAHKLLF